MKAYKIRKSVRYNKNLTDLFNYKWQTPDISQIHKIRKHIERNEVYEETLFHKSIDVSISVEEQVENKILHEELKDAIKELNDAGVCHLNI